MSDELKPLPCPFCGRVPEIEFRPIPSGYNYVIVCRGHTDYYSGRTEEEAIAAWNNRSESGELPDWLKKQLDTCPLLDGKTVAYQSGVFDTLDWFLSLRKPEDKQ